ncbi:MAG: hypothetical protein IKC11_03680 [Clostridia bacterium]|nr:hypothetical protein [Clostridia bacterium]
MFNYKYNKKRKNKEKQVKNNIKTTKYKNIVRFFSFGVFVFVLSIMR